ncbi:MAG: folate-binding protein [Pseudomonadota bacterium]
MTSLLPYSAVLRLDGPDTVDLLDRIVTCAVADLETGQTRPGALLTPQGKIIADFVLARTATGCTLAVHPSAADTLEKRLKLFRLRADVQISRDDRDAGIIDDGARIAAGQPCFGKDFGEAEVFPTDVNLDRFGGVAYSKGCFVGQEVVSRMYRRGKIRKRTVVLSGSGLEKGDDVRADGKLIGQVTSAGEIHALALLRIDHLAKTRETSTDLTVQNQTIKIDPPDWLTEEMTALMADENA